MMHSRIQVIVPRHVQQGAVLLMCLVFLTVLTMLAMTGMDSSVTEERMAKNVQDYNQAFEAATIAMEDAENWLADQVELPTANSSGTAEVWTNNSPDPDSDTNAWWTERTDAWWGTNADASSGLEQVAAQPQYIIEEYFVSTDGQSLSIGTGELGTTRVMHRVTTRGVGNSGDSEVMLQSTYIRPYD